MFLMLKPNEGASKQVPVTVLAGKSADEYAKQAQAPASEGKQAAYDELCTSITSGNREAGMKALAKFVGLCGTEFKSADD